MNDLNKTKFFYSLMCLAGFLIIALPVGIANFYFGYVLGDSPCILCWGQREAMIFIGVMALFIVRYGLKGKYLATLLVMAAFAIWQSFAHFGNHAERDLDQGFGLPIFGIHTYFWAEIVFWVVVLMLGVIFFFAPRFDSFEKELNGEKTRKFTKATSAMFIIVSVIIASNVFQAFVSTGIPPYHGQGDPVRFTFDKKYIVWDKSGWGSFWKNISFLGKRDVRNPDYAFAPASEKLGIKFDNNPENAPTKIDETLSIVSQKDLSIEAPLNSLNYINNEYVGSSKFNVFFMNDEFEINDEFELDPYFSATVDPIIGIVPYMQDKFILMGSNKSFLRFAKNPNADKFLQYADFIKGNDKFEGQGDGLGRGRINTVRAKFHHIASMATDGDYLYTATVPNNKDKNKFVISKIATKDRVLSAEFTPNADLKQDKTLGDLYITSMVYKDGLLYALSKQHNVILLIDLKNQEVVKTISFPSEIANARALILNNNKFDILSYQDNKNILFTLE
ncbi:dihydroneopterin aldolase [Campylobacter pinnipediorum subsp. caledonicus]|uniref:disulfide bond formation protein DsbI n=1 Tax=Campylobacter pinnipediorum TaxID=1965231 RepID=UPI0009956C4A|nr:disulfide bond formation protein B [Campylobacter pinnipediorum]OPA71820.1 dihydroneopterin aldolase [Campylobacter pinnipediorum subsp. caledonicus]